MEFVEPATAWKKDKVPHRHSLVIGGQERAGERPQSLERPVIGRFAEMIHNRIFVSTIRQQKIYDFEWIVLGFGDANTADQTMCCRRTEMSSNF